MKITPLQTLVTVLLGAHAVVTIAQADSGKCLTDRLTAIMGEGEQWKNSPVYTHHCAPGYTDVLKGCIGRESKANVPYGFSAPDGWLFEPDTAKFLEVGRGGTPAKTSAGITSTTDAAIGWQMSCEGHGCGGEGGVWITGHVTVKAKRTPSQKETSDIMKECGLKP